MPIYEYRCSTCNTVDETYRTIRDSVRSYYCRNGHKCERIHSVPAVHTWDQHRSFPNAVKFGEGKFPTKVAYESHLKAAGMAETRTDGKIYRPHGNKVVPRANAKA